MYIYKTLCLKTGKFYIGKCKFDPKDSIDYLGSGKILRRSISKYGKKNFIKDTLQECETVKELNQKEIFWINYFRSIDLDNVMNISSGGDWGDIYTNNPRKKEICKILQAKRWINNGKINKCIKEWELEKYLEDGWQRGRNEEYRKTISKVLKGLSKSEQHKINIGKSNKERWKQKEYRNKVCSKLKGRKHTKEEDERRSKTLLEKFKNGEIVNAQKGKTLSKKWKQKISQGLYKAYDERRR